MSKIFVPKITGIIPHAATHAPGGGDPLAFARLDVYDTGIYNRYQIVPIPYTADNPGAWFYLGILRNSSTAGSLRLDLWAHNAERPNTTADYKGATIHLTGNGWYSTPIYTFAHEIMGGISDSHSTLGYFAVYLDGSDYKLYWYSPRYAQTYITGVASAKLDPIPLGLGVNPAGTLYYSTLAAANLRASVGDLQLNGDILGGTDPVDYSATATIVGWSSFTAKDIRYLKIGKLVFIYFLLDGTSNSATTTVSLPFASMSTNTLGVINAVNNGGAAVAGKFQIAGSELRLSPTIAGSYTSWTASGVKQARGECFYFVG